MIQKQTYMKIHSFTDVNTVCCIKELLGSMVVSEPQASNLGFIRITCPCNVYPFIPTIYTEKLGFAGVYLIFLFLIQIIHCGYSLELPRRGGSNVYPQHMF